MILAVAPPNLPTTPGEIIGLALAAVICMGVYVAQSVRANRKKEDN